mmetsp:Transcript_28734/g.43428  ORF Transcript_28734/g.43428 Transcript_28734/m.43428 type:complete len:116 (+) Transcript_28734:900-1247(+)
MLGDCKEELGTMTLFQAAEMALDDSVRLDNLPTKIREVRQSLEDKEQQWEAMIKRECVAATSSGGGDPSSVWEAAFLQKLKKELEPLHLSTLLDGSKLPGRQVGKRYDMGLLTGA